MDDILLIIIVLMLWHIHDDVQSIQKHMNIIDAQGKYISVPGGE